MSGSTCLHGDFEATIDVSRLTAVEGRPVDGWSVRREGAEGTSVTVADIIAALVSHRERWEPEFWNF
jgi:hypothetical protein